MSSNIFLEVGNGEIRGIDSLWRCWRFGAKYLLYNQKYGLQEALNRMSHPLHPTRLGPVES